ncbi:MAG: hypothetical protein ACLULM_03870 [Acutalibacter sp.]
MQTQARFALGQRYIAAGAGEGFYSVDQVPGNALGAYLDGATVEVFCNAQDATGDTMNGGEIIVHGSSGDATGYAMRGGSIYIERDAGYRCGIHMKEYQQKVPAIVIGGRCGSFLGEYQAGGTIVVLGIGWEDRCPVGNFCGTGMHGGRIYLRTTHLPPDLPAQVGSPGHGGGHLPPAAPGGGILPPLPGGEGAAARLPLLCAAAQHEKSLQTALCQQLMGKEKRLAVQAEPPGACFVRRPRRCRFPRHRPPGRGQAG